MAESKAMAKKEIAVFEKAGRKDLVKHEKAETKGYAKGGLAKTQSNLRSMGRGLAKVANQKSGGKMKKGGMC